MSNISIDYNVLLKESNNINTLQKELLHKKQEVESIQSSISKISVYHNINVTIENIIYNLETEINNIKKLGNALYLISVYYKNAEKNICNDPANKSISNSRYIEAENKEKDFTEQLDDLMDFLDNFMKDFKNKYDEIVQAVQDAITINGVVAIGISGSIGAGGYLCGSVQLVVDMNGNIGLQFAGGAGVQAGASADGTAYVAVYPGMESISDTEGFGTDMGGSIGEGLVGSAGILSAGEGNEMEPVGGYAGIGIGGEATALEGHVSMSETAPTIPLGNIYTNNVDTITNAWNLSYNAWKYIYQKVN